MSPVKRGRKLTAPEKVSRDTQVILMRAKRLPWAQIAAAVNLSEQHCRAIYRAALDGGLRVLREPVPAEHVFERLLELRAIADDMAMIRKTSDTPRAQAAAARVQMNALQTRWDLMELTGLVPSPEEIGRQREVQQMGVKMAALLDSWETKLRDLGAIDERYEEFAISVLELFNPQPVCLPADPVEQKRTRNRRP